jgi:hypothetical protein
MWIESVVCPDRDVSRSDILTVAVGFSPRWTDGKDRVAERRLNCWPTFNCRYATHIRLLSPFRGLKPTATVIASLREATTPRSETLS